MDPLLRAGLVQLRDGDETLNRLISRRGLDTAAALLLRYIEEIELFNPAYGLVGAKDREEIITRHILDSLAPAGVIVRQLESAGFSFGAEGSPGETRASIADIGSGAGLPGIPLSILLPETAVTLVERMGRRAGFLRNTLAVLELSGIAVEETDMEKAKPGRFDLITFRAFRPLSPQILKGLFRLLAPGGVLAAYKGKRDSIDTEMAAVSDLVLSWEIRETPVPYLNEERHLVLITSR
ncbi:16S rRNA (guanine(527)-N(7))-methyltransferase RsmG [Breznakiella homolactica]|uniref:Ribosomal RNA small subunit methyltransferase G n=1 Tax=Breznakiella homolactica TaxID=2798577 RepID=A0A7T8BAE8_9SPIR|nr:16S rRNA (guanine(527)-N(7))-methyltransferase RsmG [Breznakiella homolactica]QQO10594.1 16S rRNA (guanine(527)-N(7))-methyltransferase RsmG [Breznakiella homolactica]